MVIHRPRPPSYPCNEGTKVRFEGLPESYQSDIQTAIAVLTSLGARDVFVFGSVVSREGSALPRDIDIAVAGLPKERFFQAYGQLMMNMVHEVDLVDPDDDRAFVQFLKDRGNLERVA